MFHPLMNESINQDDFNRLIDFLKTNPRVTSGKKVEQFEEAWSKWLGVKHSLYVNSGSSANILTWNALALEDPQKKEVIVPPLTWISDIAALVYAGFEPVFVDINLNNLALSYDRIKKSVTDNTYGIFITHVLGLNGLTEELLKLMEDHDLKLIEDCCEAHGAKYKNEKLGSLGLVSNFSFYFAHHMTTIEGGMISTNDSELFNKMRMLRSHGMLRESRDDNYIKNIKQEHPDLHTEFIFPSLGFNFRGNELGAVLGVSQLERLDQNILKRNHNFEIFLKNLNDNFFTDFNLEGQSNYAFILILKESNSELMNRICKALTKHDVEYRRGLSGGGNQLRQPYAKKLFNLDLDNFQNIEHIHFNSLYLGNYPELEEDKILELVNIINQACE